MNAETIVLSCLFASSILFLTAFSKEGKVEICRVIYNPQGIEPNGEVIEVCNEGRDAVDLSGWTISDGEGEYEIPSQTILNPGETLELTGKTLNPTSATQRIWLANKKDCVTLSSREGKEIDDKCWTKFTGTEPPLRFKTPLPLLLARSKK